MTMVALPTVSILTPVAAYHRDRIPEVQAVVASQTVACDHLIYEDTDGRGAGYARNVLLARASTPFVIFLDADDSIAPDFVARALQAHMPGHYVYTDWMQAGNHHRPPSADDVWRGGTHHCITTLLETDHARCIGGFDEVMPGAEDSDFYIRLRLSGVCPKHLPEPLFTYGKGGERSRALMTGGQLPAVQQYMKDRYGGYLMACCGGNNNQTQQTVAGEFEGAVLATAMWAGNRRMIGMVSGRNYPRTGNRKQVYVDPRDMAARPDLWQPVQDTPEQNGVILQPRKQNTQPARQPAGSLSDVAQFFMGGGKAQPMQPVPMNNIPAAALTPIEIVNQGQSAIG